MKIMIVIEGDATTLQDIEATLLRTVRQTRTLSACVIVQDDSDYPSEDADRVVVDVGRSCPMGQYREIIDWDIGEGGIILKIA